VLQDPEEPEVSGFRTVTVDLAAGTIAEARFQWKEGAYLPNERAAPYPLRRNRSARAHTFLWTDVFNQTIEDIGTGFSHPRRDVLILSDLYVPPELSARTLEDQERSLSRLRSIKSLGALEFLTERSRCIIMGDDKAGKTALAKMLMQRLQGLGLVPLLVSGAELRPKFTTDIAGMLKPLIERQYGRDAVDRFLQLPRDRKCILVDDFHKCMLNRAGQAAIVQGLSGQADRLLLFADTMHRFEELQRDVAHGPFADFDYAEILELGHSLRAKLIERWHVLGRELDFPDRNLILETTRSERLVDSLLGKNLLPASPFSVLTILQLAEAGRDVSRDAGSYGSMYEALINTRLAEESLAVEMSINQSFLSELANRMFRTGGNRLSVDEVQECGADYEQRFAMNLHLDMRLANLVQRGMLRRDERGWRFCYPYIYYYFVARWYRDEIGRNQGTRADLLKMADRVHSDRNVNVLLFYLSLSQDRAVIERVLSNATEIYSEQPCCDLDEDVAFLDLLFKGQIEDEPVQLPAASAATRESVRAARDAHAFAANEPEEVDVDISYGPELATVIKLNIAFKTLHILGQFVRSFPGAIEKELKERIVGESYRLGLRSLNAVLRTAEGNLQRLREYFREVVRERQALLSDAETKRVGDSAVLWLTKACAFGVVARVSNAVGLQALAHTYAAVLHGFETVATRMIDMAVRLDHFDEFPEDEVFALAKDTRKSFFATAVLRDLITHHLLVFRVSPELRQRLTARLEAGRPNAPQLFDGPLRRLGS